jgi:23S rRNA pseudouridine2605 synthase
MSAGRERSGRARAGEVSLARALSKLGVCSRKEAARWIQAGRVRVGGRVVRSPSRRVDPGRDLLRLDGRTLREPTERVVIAFHKPVGLVTSRVDPAGRATIYDRLSGVGRWVFPVGRLDRDSAGLLLLTNDHRLGHRLADPAHGVPKAYHARVRGLPGEEALRALREGVDIGDGPPTRPARVRCLGAARAGGTWLEIVLTEGRNRQVRRMCAAIGHDVRELTRVRIGHLSLGDLAPGEWRRLEGREVAELWRESSRGHAGAPRPRGG